MKLALYIYFKVQTVEEMPGRLWISFVNLVNLNWQPLMASFWQEWDGGGRWGRGGPRVSAGFDVKQWKQA